MHISLILPGLGANRTDDLEFVVVRMSERFLEKHPADPKSSSAGFSSLAVQKTQKRS